MKSRACLLKCAINSPTDKSVLKLVEQADIDAPLLIALIRGAMCGVEVWRGGLGGAYLLPTLSSVGASLAPPCFRFQTPAHRTGRADLPHPALGEDSRNRHSIACDAVCNF
jgi:hypothetical protein